MTDKHRPRMSSWLVWSNQHGEWWRANRSGYTLYIEQAGRYSTLEALEIVRSATCNGALHTRREDPVTGQVYTSFDEVMVLAPESPVTAASARPMSDSDQLT